METDIEASKKVNRKGTTWLWILVGFATALTLTWLILTPKGILGKADAIGYSVCHQIESRSFSINGRPFPLCARCSGLFLGALLGLVYQAIQGRKGRMPPIGASIFFGLLAFAWIFDGSNSFLMFVPSITTFYQTQNWTRLVTGMGMGLAVSAILRPAFIQTMYRYWEDKAALGGWRQIMGLVIAAGMLIVLILLEIRWILFPLALLGAGGVLSLLMIIYSMALVMLFKRDNTFDRFSQLVLPLLGGYVVALLQIGVINLLRYLLTGTWGGFVL